MKRILALGMTLCLLLADLPVPGTTSAFIAAIRRKIEAVSAWQWIILPLNAPTLRCSSI